jgi:DMSO/TMAO reductase YedYZ molybdopterin-dependent catalytic subunit
MFSRRRFLALSAAGVAAPGWAKTANLHLPGGPSARPLSDAFPQKRGMIVQRTVPPLLETPMTVFNGALLTPNDRHYVRWHWPFPTEIDVAAWRLAVTGAVTRPLSLSLAELQKLPHHELVAVNQCAGNARGLFEPRVPGAQWGNGAMANARWTGVRLKDVLDRARVKAGAVAVRFGGADAPPVEGAPDFRKSLGVDHARDGEVMIAWAMNGAPLPLLNGLPLRLVVPGWYATYWVKMLDSVEVLDAPDDGYWMTKSYLIPANPTANVAPGTSDYAKIPIGPMVPRSFITSVGEGETLRRASQIGVGGVAFGGDCGVKSVEVSGDSGGNWVAARLGEDLGPYGFRRFDVDLTLPRGGATLLTRCTNTRGVTQPMTANWNPSGYQRGVVEQLRVTVA